jgi:hypothetical protein
MTTTAAVQVGSEKLVHHRCGYPLRARVIDVLEWCPAWRTAYTPPAVVVNYRDTKGHVVFLCPKCGKLLQLWWELEDSHEEE